VACLSRRGGRERIAAAHLTGVTEEQISEFGVTFGLGGLMLFMLFIIWDLARKSKAGRLGTFVLFFVLAFGMLGFIAKQIIAWLLGL
jgi:hypothetical protein